MARRLEPARAIAMSEQQHASTLGQFSWALFEWARNPYYILIVIYIFGPYFSTHVIGDPVRGQEIWGYINGFAGAVTACLAPFLGAVADKVGRRKPWIGCFIAMMVPAILLLWLAGTGRIVTLAGPLAVAGTRRARCRRHRLRLHRGVPQRHASRRWCRTRGWARCPAGGSHSATARALIILVGMLYAFALPASGLLDWGWLPDQVMFGMDTAMFEHDRIARTDYGGLARDIRPATVLLHARSEQHRRHGEPSRQAQPAHQRSSATATFSGSRPTAHTSPNATSSSTRHVLSTTARWRS